MEIKILHPGVSARASREGVAWEPSDDTRSSRLREGGYACSAGRKPPQHRAKCEWQLWIKFLWSLLLGHFITKCFLFQTILWGFIHQNGAEKQSKRSVPFSAVCTYTMDAIAAEGLSFNLFCHRNMLIDLSDER